MGHDETFSEQMASVVGPAGGAARSKRLLLNDDSLQGLVDGFRCGRLSLDQDALVRELIEHLPVRVFWKDRASCYLGCNALFARDAGFASPAELLGRSDLECVWAAEAPAYRADDLAVMQSGEPKLDIIEPQTTPTGSRLWLKTSKLPLRDTSGAIIGVLGIYQDITAVREAEESRRIAASVFEHAREGIALTDVRGRILAVNPAFTRLTGYSAEEAVGQSTALLSSGRHPPAFYQEMWQSLMENGYWEGEIWNRRKNGEHYAELLSIGAIRGEDGAVIRFVATFNDITQTKQRESDLSQMAYFDRLTGLPNRQLFLDRLRMAMAQADRRAAPLAVAYIDLDHFKQVNDLHGHAAGDEVLVTVAQAMQKVLREGDTLARFGGDEFVALLCDVGREQDLLLVANRLIAAAAVAWGRPPRRVQVGASVGLSRYPQSQRLDMEALLQQADQAMYQAKLAGRGCVRVYAPGCPPEAP